jgi:hypothetical protein
MKKIILFIPLFLIIAKVILAQNPVTTDTTAKKNEVARTDTAVKKEPVAPQQQAQTAAVKSRKDTRPLKDRIDFDVPVSFWVNSYQVYGDLSFLVSYRFPKILNIGVGPTYVFSYQRGESQYLNGIGGKIFVRASLLKFFYLWTEYQGLSNQYITDWSPVTVSRGYVDSWFAGAGFNLRLGRRFGINMSVLYDFLHGSASPYSSATTYRFGFSF